MPESIFRAEAVQDRARLQGPGEVAKIGPTWTTRAFWALLALVAVALVAASIIEIDRYAPGTTASGTDGRVVVIVPAVLASEIAPGRPVTIGDLEAKVVASGERVLYPPEVRERFGVEVAVPSVAVVTSASAGATPAGSARVLVESEPLIVALVPGLKALFGGGDA